MNVLVDVTVRDEDGHILHESTNKLFQTKSEFRSAEYTIEKLDLIVAMMIPTNFKENLKNEREQQQ